MSFHGKSINILDTYLKFKVADYKNDNREHCYSKPCLLPRPYFLLLFCFPSIFFPSWFYYPSYLFPALSVLLWSDRLVSCAYSVCGFWSRTSEASALLWNFLLPVCITCLSVLWIICLPGLRVIFLPFLWTALPACFYFSESSFN